LELCILLPVLWCQLVMRATSEWKPSDDIFEAGQPQAHLSLLAPPAAKLQDERARNPTSTLDLNSCPAIKPHPSPSPSPLATMDNPNDPPLDEIQWRSPQTVATMGGLHSNTILFYFAESPFFERTSNNAVITSQAMNNMSMYHFIQTREAFEGRLKTMSGLEFIVGEEPAETGPGMGTGVWVIRKQSRRKRYQEDDDITVHASFFVVGENIYMAPTLADILASRIVCHSRAVYPK
jgi:hypothetical protein